jgi:prolipoprotein diacylglyceryl transferase
MIFVNDINPILFEYGPLSIRWYGLFFATGLVLNYMILRWIFVREKLSIWHLESLALYLFLGLVIGARLGHVFFYNFEYFAAHPLEIFQIWNGGLSSHGATIGLTVALLIWTKVHKVPFSKYVDYLAIPMPLTAAFVRIGNFFNSEIVGLPTNSDFGVVFKKLGEDFPRYPSQLFEAVVLLIIFWILMRLYLGAGQPSQAGAVRQKYPPLFFLFTFIFLYFSARFILEYWKDLHVLPEGFPLSMGQVLSIIPILISVGYFAWLLFRKKPAKS